MNVDVLSARFEAYKQDCAIDRQALASELKENRLAFQAYCEKMNAQLESKVSYKHFYWLVGVFLPILMIIFGYISTQLRDLSVSSSATQQDVASLKGKLSPYDVQFEK